MFLHTRQLVEITLPSSSESLDGARPIKSTMSHFVYLYSILVALYLLHIIILTL